MTTGDHPVRIGVGLRLEESPLARSFSRPKIVAAEETPPVSLEEELHAVPVVTRNCTPYLRCVELYSTDVEVHSPPEPLFFIPQL